ncbi:pollen-specific protein C13-like [Neltuma alba]|uniref:pollen-specific protein C13-like n=1 Tax=Neltuma alba TaxID=207710 RepID=UPI0010A2DEE8|nr:pollen-specific protein C13-like [Prosopis alba]
MATRVSFLLLLCALPALVAAIRPERNPFTVRGRVYCDTCRAGFETSATTYIAGAEVVVECKERNTLQVVYRKKGRTDSTGTYKILVDEDHADQVCDAKVVSSPQSDCNEAAPGRDQARVILTRNNGIASDDRAVNAVGFMKAEAASVCAEVLKQYEEFDNEN